MKKLLPLIVLAFLLSGCALFANKDLITTANQFANMPEGKERCKLLATDLNLAATMKMFGGQEATDQEVEQGAAGFQLLAAAGCYSELAISTSDVEICKEIEPLDTRLSTEFPDEAGANYEDSMTLEDTCYMGFASEKKDIKFCDYVGVAVREMCRMSADPNFMSQMEGYEESLEESADQLEEAQDGIMGSEESNQAVTDLEDVRSGMSVIDNAVVEATLETNDLAGCLSESTNTDLCYDAFARKFGKASLCTKIVDTTLKNSCKAAVATRGGGGA